jgi:hypothetical protein
VFLWFAGGAFVLVWVVFRSPAVDYRLVMVGAVLPVGELPFGSPRLLHSLTAAAAALGLAMLVTPRRRLAQRRLVAVPIGMFIHLEALGAAALWWCWRRFRLYEPARRARFLRTGQLDRDVVTP